MTPRFASRGRQRGAFAVAFALMAITLFGFIGLAVDAGRLFIAKTELQNAADACALAAAGALTAASSTPNGVQARVAENYGITAGTRNKIGMQQTAVTIRANSTDVTFSTNGLAGPWLRRAVAAVSENSITHVQCRVHDTAVQPILMRVLNALTAGSVGAKTARAVAVASLAPSVAATCPIPIAVCIKTPPVPCNAPTCFPSVGYKIGEWAVGITSAGSGSTGSYGFIDYPDSASQCSDPPCISAAFLNSGNCPATISSHVSSRPGQISSVDCEFNSRFGVKKSSCTAGKADLTGFQYYSNSGPPSPWPMNTSAFADYLVKQQSKTPADDTRLKNPWASDATANAAGDPQRRLVTAPVVFCDDKASQYVPGDPYLFQSSKPSVAIKDWACLLLLNPSTSPSEDVYMEFRGLASNASSAWPCAQWGLAGGGSSGGSGGPRVPALVQ